LNGIIFDIKRFAVHDGPGIRTAIFFKGCPLHCLWCHNPEGVLPRFELMPRQSRCAAECFDCIKACPGGALSKKDGKIAIDQKRCDDDICLACSEACMYDALQLVGKRMTAADLVREVEKDRIFFEQSGGGVTFTGGEPLIQHEFLLELLAKLKPKGIHTALDTSGFASWQVLHSVARECDLVLYDIKMMNEAKHKKYTGVSNKLILDNLKKLSATGKEIWIRIPLVPGVNDDDENIRQTADFLKSLTNVQRIAVLPYHKGGTEKAKNLGTESSFRVFDLPSEEHVAAIMKTLSDRGFIVRKGG